MVDRSLSLHHPAQTQLCPWPSDPEDFHLFSSKIKSLKNTQLSFRQRNSTLRKTKMQRFNKIITDHRNRIMKKTHNSSTCPINESIQKQRTKETQVSNHEGSAIKEEQTNFGRSTVVGKITQKIKQMREFRTNINCTPYSRYIDEKQMIRAFYRSKTNSKNADKYYGRKGTDFSSTTKFRSTTCVFQQEQPLNQRKTILIQPSLNKSKPTKSLIQIKLVNYKSWKASEKDKFMQDLKQKKNKILSSKNHILDRIMANRY